MNSVSGNSINPQTTTNALAGSATIASQQDAALEQQGATSQNIAGQPNSAQATTPANDNQPVIAVGVTIQVRDELWIVTGVHTVAVADPATNTPATLRVRARGISEYVKDQEAIFFSDIDTITIIDPLDVQVAVDSSPGYRQARIFVESLLRNTPAPLYQHSLEVADRMLLNPLDYQQAAVQKALSTDNVRPRLLLADAVGLGKTLEIGMILAELVRRGRGERILVVTPRHVLEQFQQEMWTRFALPFIRLDSQGIQKVRQLLPASRNPFSYFPKVMVSLDTIKSPRYRAQLEKVRWDAVVIDEIHNATNAGTQNNQLARMLAPTTEALILASATPHNGDPNSFKEILRLLDPTSVLPDGTIDATAASRLILRRHRNSPEVKNTVGAEWAPRKEPRNIAVPASAAEQALLAELHATWLQDDSAQQLGIDPLFPWTLMKAALSSPAAFAETTQRRLDNLDRKATCTIPDHQAEHAALEKLLALNAAIPAQQSNKYQALLDYLAEIQVGPKQPTRVVVFSERVATLHWLKENLQRDLKMKDAQVVVMHGQLNDQEQMAIIDSFKREDSPIRILVTGDVASEGVNLHAQCHHLVHYDIPWSLIRIQQRNGRIDRYGQHHSPQITTLLLDPAESDLPSDITVLARLVEREHQAHEMIGDAAALMGEYSEAREEDQIREVLRGRKNFEEVVANPQTPGTLSHDDIMALFSGDATVTDLVNPVNPVTPEQAKVTLYPDDIDFLVDCLEEAFSYPSASAADGGVSFHRHANATADLQPPKDLQERLAFLPRNYLKERRVLERFALATNTYEGIRQLDAAKRGESGSTWPQAHFLGPLHPITTWAAERALANYPRQTIPSIMHSDPQGQLMIYFLVTLSNKRGQVVNRSFFKVIKFGEALSTMPLDNLIQDLEAQGLSQHSVNTQRTVVPENISELIKQGARQVSEYMESAKEATNVQAQARIADYQQRAQAWQENKQAQDAKRHRRDHNQEKRAATVAEESQLVETLAPEDVLVRPILVITPHRLLSEM